MGCSSGNTIHEIIHPIHPKIEIINNEQKTYNDSQLSKETKTEILSLNYKYYQIIGINIGALNTIYSTLSFATGKYSYNNLFMNSKREIPSLICYANKILIGDNAKNFLKKYLDNSYNNLSRIIGYDDSVIYKNEDKYMYNSEINKKNIKEIGSECIIATFLFKINQYFNLISEKKYDLTSISVPDFYTKKQKQILKIICESIDMKDVYIFNESSAITMFYGYTKYHEMFGEDSNLDKNYEKYVLFIDIGHSKSSFILSKFKYNEFKVEKVLYNENLGGRNIDLMIYNYCIKKANIDSSKLENKKKYILLEEIKKQKINFVNKNEIQFSIDDDLDININENEFKNIISEFIKEIEKMCDEIKKYIEDNKIELNTIECAGNLFKLPILQKIFLDKNISTSNNINEYGISQTIQTNECISVGTMLLIKFYNKNFILKELENFIEANNKDMKNIKNDNLNNNQLKKKIKEYIQKHFKNENLYEEFRKKKENCIIYINSLQKIKKMSKENIQKLNEFHNIFKNYTYNNENDIQKINDIYKHIKQCASSIIDDLIKQIKDNNIIKNLQEIKNNLNNINKENEALNKENEILFKELENLFLNKIDKIDN